MAYDHSGVDVGSQQSLDVYCGYGTAFKNPDEFKLDMSERVHMLGATSSPFLSWLQKVRTKTATQIMFSWIESEQFTQRDIKATLLRVAHPDDLDSYCWALKLNTAADWMAFAAAAKADSWASATEKPLIFLTIYKASAPTTNYYSAVIEAPALRLGQTIRDIEFASDGKTAFAGALNMITVFDDGEVAAKVGGAADELSAIPSGMGLQESFTGFAASFNAASTEVYVSVSTPNDYLKGYAQGSGLPTESRRTTRSLRNYTQIFKTPMSVSGSMQAISAAGGTYTGDDLAKLRYDKGIEHKIDIETAILFQAGGEEGTDWGELTTTPGTQVFENPITRFKGMGVGLAVNGLTAKPGFIQTKNADLDARFQFDWDAADMSDLNALIGAIFDDNVDNPSSRKICFCSKKWLGVLAAMGLKGESNGLMTFGTRIAAPGELGIIVKTITSPMGSLDFVELPRLRGKYEDYALVVDFEYMEWKPLVNRATFLKSNAGRQDLDGTLDFYLTEGGFKMAHESCHAVLKLV